MSKGKKSFILYLDQQELFNKLPDEIAGKLIKHIFSYVNCENPEASDLLLDIAFSPIKQSLKRDLNKWETQLEQRSRAGKISAERRATKANEVQRKATTVESRSTKSTDNVSVSVNVSDSVSEVTKDIVAKAPIKRFVSPTVDDVYQYCNERCNNVDAQNFVDHYITNGWMRGKAKIKDWKACVRTWEKNSNSTIKQTESLKGKW